MNIINLVFLLITQLFFSYNNGAELSSTDISHLSKSKIMGQCKSNNPWTGVASNIVFQSTDGGLSWLDVSKGLPASEQMDSFFTGHDKGLIASEADGFFASDTDIYLRIKGATYHGKSDGAFPQWKKEMFLDEGNNAIAFGQSGVFSYNYNGNIMQKINASGMWVPTYSNLQPIMMRTIFESSLKTVFVGCDNGLFRSSDDGITWKHILHEGWIMKIAESKGILIATSEKGIMRSTDDGKTWGLVVSEGGVGIAAETIDSGFAVITYNTTTKSRRIRISSDEGKTWQLIDAGLPPSASIASIKQVGDYFFCGHPDGIFRSSDKGKTWSLVLPPSGKKVYNLYTSGNKIFAVPMNSGC